MTGLGEVLSTARRASGLTQAELAKRAGITQAALSRYENDDRHPDEQTVDALAQALGVTARFLQHGGRARGAMGVDAHMRRRATAPATTWKRLEAQLNMYRMHASLLSEDVRLHAESRLPTMDPLETDPSAAARIVRMQWGMPIGPVRQLVTWVEAAGCLVIEESFGTVRVDGMSQWIGDLPVVYLNADMPTDRKRLTLGHELGHLVLHATYVTEDMEDEANAFAAELLMPMEVIRPQLRNLRVDQLPAMKQQWGVSMAAIVERAYRAGLMPAPQRTRIYKAFSARGWRTREPGSEQLARERPAMVQLIPEALQLRGFDADEIARLAGFSSAKDNGLFPTHSRGLRAI